MSTIHLNTLKLKYEGDPVDPDESSAIQKAGDEYEVDPDAYLHPESDGDEEDEEDEEDEMEMESDEPELDSDEESLDEDEIRQARYYKNRKYEIIEQGGRVLGSLRIWFFDLFALEEEGESFFMLADELDHESSDFAATLFSDNGTIKSKYAREGTGVWRTDVTDTGTIAYLEEIRVKAEFRNQGVGSRMMKELWRSDDAELANIDFLFALPCSLHSEFPEVVPYNAPDPNKEAKIEMSKRVVEFFRRAHFRRVGTTQYFCAARSPSHPSRRIPIDHDTDEAPRSDDVSPGDARLFEVIAQQLYGRK